MASSVDLIVNITTKMAGAGMDQAEKQTSKFKSGLNKASVGAGLALGAVVAFGKGAADAASDVQQSLGAVDAVFGKNADTIKKWADNSASKVGLSKNAYMEMATVTGAQLKNMGLPMDQVTGKTGDLIKKAADLSATFGGTTKDAVESIGAALRGETDPIEKYGVSIKQADIAAQQAKEGTDKLTGAAGKQAKTMALLHLMNKQTADSTGAFSKESDTAAHAAQVSSAQYEDMQAALGEALLPAITMVTTVLGNLAKMMAKHKTATKVVIVVIAALAVAIIALNLAVTIYTAVTTLAASATIAAWVAAALPIVAIVAVVLLVVGAVVLLWKKSETFRSIVLGVWGALKTAVAAVGHAIMAAGTAIETAWNAVGSAVSATVHAIGRAAVAAWHGVTAAAAFMARGVRNAWNAIKSGAAAVANFVRNLWRRVWSAIAGFVRAYFNAYKAVFNAIRSVASAALSFLTSRFRAVFNGLKSVVQGLWHAWQGVAQNIRNVATNAFNAVKTAAMNAVKQAITAFSGLPGKIKAAFSGAATLLYGIGSDIIHGLVRGIEAAAGAIMSAVDAIIGKIPKFIRKKMGIASPSKVMAKIGHDIMRGLVVGMADGVAGVRKVSQLAVDTITKTIKAAAKTAKQARTLTRAAVKSVADESAALVKNAKKRQAVYDAIKKQTGILAEQKAAWDQLKGSVADTAQAFGSFAGAAGTTIQDMVADMTSKVKQVQLFQETMAALAKLRLNKTTLSELAQAGPENALERALALLGGGAGAVTAVNKLQGQLGKAADTLGTQTADAMFKTGMDATQALLDGMVADKQRLERAANTLARNLAAAVRRALARYTPKPSKGKAGKAAPSAASYAAPALTTPAARGVGAAGGGTTIVNVNGAVDPDSTARQIRRILDGHDRRIGLRVA